MCPVLKDIQSKYQRFHIKSHISSDRCSWMIMQELMKPECLSPVGWDPCQNARTTFPFFAAEGDREEGSFSISLLSFPLSARSFSAALFLRSPDQSVAKRGLQTSRVPGESLPSPPKRPPIRCGRKEESVAQAATPRATWNRNVIIIVGLRIRMFFRSSNLLTYYTTAHRHARNNGLASGAIPILCKCQRSPPLHVSPRLATSSLYALLNRVMLILKGTTNSSNTIYNCGFTNASKCWTLIKRWVYFCEKSLLCFLIVNVFSNILEKFWINI